MRNALFRALGVVLVAGICFNAFGAGRECSSVSARACEIARSLGRGVNFGMALESLNSGGELTESDWRKVRDASERFNNVRLLVSFPDFASADSSAVLDTAFMARVDRLVNYFLDRNVAVVLAMHRYNQLTGDPLRKSQRRVREEDLRPRFVSMWSQIAGRYRNRAPRLAFEIYNEPHGALDPSAWNSLLRDTVRAVALIDPERVMILDSPNYANAYFLWSLTLPLDVSRNLVASVHSYRPMNFTHQGAGWVADRYPLGVGCCTDPQVTEVRKFVEFASTWSANKGVPVYIGEFGAIEYADGLSRANYAKSSREIFESFGMSWSYWEMGEGFRIHLGDQGWSPLLTNALFD